MESGVRVFTNIDSEEFTGMYHGKEYTIKTGKDKAFPEKLAKHLASQLAYKMLMKKDPETLLGDDKQKELAKTIVSDLVMEEPEEEKEETIEKPEKKEEEVFEDLKPKKKPKKRVYKRKKK